MSIYKQNINNCYKIGVGTINLDSLFSNKDIEINIVPMKDYYFLFDIMIW